jgi:tetratricopeptide (TPR) repeat protein
MEDALKTGLSSSPEDLAKVKAWIRQEPRNSVAYEILGRIHASRKEYDKACTAWKECLRWSRGDSALALAAVHEQIAEMRLLLGQRTEAMREYGHAARAFRKGRTEPLDAIMRDDARVREARCLAHLGRLGEAVRLLRQIRRGPNPETFEETIQDIARSFPALSLDGRPRRR